MNNLAIKEIDLIENQVARQSLMNKVDVLEKVKELILLTNTELMTTKMVADWYEVKEDVIRKTLERNRSELIENGVMSLSGERLRDIKSHSGLKTRAKTVTVFSKRALLNIGMLLRDSTIAKRVRTALLDQQETMTDEQKTLHIDQEKELALKIMFADSEEEKMLAFNNYRQFKNRYIMELENTIKENEPKLDAWGTFINSNSTFSFTDTAKMISTRANDEEGVNINISNKKLTKFLRDVGVLSKRKSRGNYTNQPNKNYEEYFNVATADAGKEGEKFKVTQTKVKTNGLEFIYNLLKKKKFNL